MEKGIFTSEQEKYIAEALYNLVNRKRKIPGFVKWIVRLMVRYIDNKKVESLPDTWKQVLVPIVAAAFAKNYDELQLQVANLLNNKIDIPRIPEQVEQVMFEMFTKTTALAIQKYAEKHRKAA